MNDPDSPAGCLVVLLTFALVLAIGLYACSRPVVVFPQAKDARR